MLEPCIVGIRITFSSKYQTNWFNHSEIDAMVCVLPFSAHFGWLLSNDLETRVCLFYSDYYVMTPNLKEKPKSQKAKKSKLILCLKPK